MHGHGNLLAKIVIVTRNPEISDLHRHESLTGSFGDNFYRWLKLYRHEVFHTWLSPFTSVQPTKESIETLFQFLQESPATVIVPLDSDSTRVLANKYNHNDQRGSILHNPRLPNKKIIPTIHPTVAHRSFEFTYVLEHDLELILRESETSTTTTTPRSCSST